MLLITRPIGYTEKISPDHFRTLSLADLTATRGPSQNRMSAPIAVYSDTCFNQTLLARYGEVFIIAERNVDHLKRIIAVLIGVVALLLPTVGAAAHASTPSGRTPITQPNTDPVYPYGQLINWDRGADGSQRCAGLYGTSTTDNTVFTEYTCGSPGFNDKWLLIANFSGSGGTWYQLKNQYSGKCAMPINYSKTVGADVVQVTCTAPASSSGSCSNACSVQLWRFQDVGTGYGNYQRLYNRYSNQCLNLKSGVLLDGTHIAQTNCGSSHLSDIWLLYPS